MPQWRPFYGWMAFDNLNQGFGLTRAFTIGFRFTDDSSEEWTERFNRFKRKRLKALRGGAVLMASAVPRLVRRLELDTSRTVFIPALSSCETVASEDGVLAKLTHYCAQVTNARFIGDAVTKQEHAPLHNYTRADRRREILDAAEFRSQRIRKADNCLVFDDFITTGDTLSHIAQAILEANPHVSVYGVGLGKTERLRYHREMFGHELSNDHVPTKWERKWKESEAR